MRVSIYGCRSHIYFSIVYAFASQNQVLVGCTQAQAVDASFSSSFLFVFRLFFSTQVCITLIQSSEQTRKATMVKVE